MFIVFVYRILFQNLTLNDIIMYIFFSVAPTLPQEEPLVYDIGPAGSFWLSWRPADFPLYMSDSSPVTYTIYVQEPPSTTWRPLVRRIPHPFYPITNLRNDRDYSFRVQAENEFGLSRPTLPVKLLGVKSKCFFRPQNMDFS